MDRQESRRVDVAGVIDEREPRPGIDRQRGAWRARIRDAFAQQLVGLAGEPLVELSVANWALFALTDGFALEGDASVLRCLGRLDGNARGVVVQPVQYVLTL